MATYQAFPPALMVISPCATLTSDPSTSVEGINTTPLADGALVYCLEDAETFRLDKADETTPPDGTTVIEPAAGPGRWKIFGSGGTGGACTTNNVVITGQYACAENDQTRALGAASFAVGYKSIAGAEGAMAQGGVASFALDGGLAMGLASHAEGIGSTAAGFASHAEGYGSAAAGLYSHAEGVAITGSGKFAFTIAAGGVTVTIPGQNAVKWFRALEAAYISPTTPAPAASLTANVATDAVFAAGDTTFDIAAPLDLVTTGGIITATSFGDAAHAEGLGTAVGSGAHAEGSSTLAVGLASHAEGSATVATDQGAHSEGANGIAFGENSHAEGTGSRASTSAHAEGSGNWASGAFSHAEGGPGNIAGNEVRVFSCVAGATAIVFAGMDVRAEFPNGSTILVVPQAPFFGPTAIRTVVGVPVFAAGDTTVTLSAAIDAWTVSGGAVWPNVGLSAHVEGGRPSVGIAARNIARGEGAHAEGTATLAAGVASHAEGSTCLAAGLGSHAGGRNALAVGQSSFAHGDNGLLAFGVAASCLGYAVVAIGDYAHAEGGNCSAGVGSSLFSVAAGGVTVTLVGDFTADYLSGATVTVGPGVPEVLASVTRTVATSPVFAAGNTTFDLSAAIDLYTTAGYIAPTGLSLQTQMNGSRAHAEGRDNIAAGFASHAEGDTNSVYGAAASVSGSLCRVGDYPFSFTCAAAGVTLTFPGDVTYRFSIEDNIYIVPANGQPAVTRALVTVPVFAAGNTTFDIDAAINGTTVAGRATREFNGSASTSGGNNCVTAFQSAEAKGYRALGSRDDEVVHGALIATGGAGGPYAPGLGAAQFSRQVRSALLPTVGAGGTLTFLYDLYQSKVYSLQIRTVVTDNAVAAPTVYVMESRDVLVSVDASRVVTIQANQLVLLQDPAVALVTMDVSVAGVGQLGIDLTNPNPAIYRVICTIESTEISSVDITAT